LKDGEGLAIDPEADEGAGVDASLGSGPCSSSIVMTGGEDEKEEGGMIVIVEGGGNEPSSWLSSLWGTVRGGRALSLSLLL
jgi:hypothetical protein